jgi:transposase InsO family protein
MKYQFIADHSHEFPIMRMCRVLVVSTSGYYAWRGRPQSQRAQDNLKLVERIKEVHAASREIYGSPRVHAELVDSQGIHCNKKRVERLMRIHDIRGRQRRRRRVKTTDSNHSLPVAPNLLDRQFEADAPNRKWVADITYVPTAQGWLYLAVVLDLFSRRVIGWSMADTMCTLLVKGALNMAISVRRPQAGLLHHSDRGSQYASAEYQAVLETCEMVASMSRAGNCYDNAAMESFFGTLKCELIHDRRYRTRAEARQDIFEYIEVFYNRERRHSSLGYLSPVAYEELCQLCLN